VLFLSPDSPETADHTEGPSFTTERLRLSSNSSRVEIQQVTARHAEKVLLSSQQQDAGKPVHQDKKPATMSRAFCNLK
jgi:hypothetical protein